MLPKLRLSDTAKVTELGQHSSLGHLNPLGFVREGLDSLRPSLVAWCPPPTSSAGHLALSHPSLLLCIYLLI